MELNEITNVLFKEMDLLVNECDSCKTHLSRLEVLPEAEIIFQRRLDELSDFTNQIRIHQDLGKKELTSVDFYSGISAYFQRKGYEKVVKFTVQEGFDGEPNSRLEQEDLKHFFTINNCLPVMRIVPTQLASNARKYMPKGTELTVKLLVTSKKNFITMTNVGPKNENEELSNILTFGGRGSNTTHVNGMGMGLKQVRDIFNLHHEWLDTAFSVSSSDEGFLLNCIPYSNFNVNISYSNGSSIVDRDAINSSFTDWVNDLPIILIHNMLDITTNLQTFCRDKLEKISVADKKAPWREPIFKLRVGINRMVDVLHQCLYATLELNEENMSYIMGNDCKVALHKTMQMTFLNLKNTIYKNKPIEYDFTSMQRLQNIDATSSIYPFFTGLLSLVLDDLKPFDKLVVTYESDPKGNSVIINCDNHDFEPTFSAGNKDEIINNRICMYNEMMDMWNGEIKVRNDTIKLYFWK